MRFLFVHQNFPGQYVHIARHLTQTGHQVSFVTQPRRAEIEGIRKIEYRPTLNNTDPSAHLHEFENGVANGLAVARVCHWLDRDGYIPDIVIGHNGVGGNSLRQGRVAADPATGLFRILLSTEWI